MNPVEKPTFFRCPVCRGRHIRYALGVAYCADCGNGYPGNDEETAP